jgi:hypothetical protein
MMREPGRRDGQKEHSHLLKYQVLSARKAQRRRGLSWRTQNAKSKVKVLFSVFSMTPPNHHDNPAHNILQQSKSKFYRMIPSPTPSPLSFWILLLFLSSSLLSTAMAASGYEQMCVVDPLLFKEFPVANRRSLLREGRFIEAVQASDDDERVNRNQASQSSSSPTVRFYRCICENQDFHDNRTTNSYCPLETACGIGFDPLQPVECVDHKVMNSVARMAWPIFLTSTMCLILILTASYYGKAVALYIRKKLLGSRIMSYCCCCCISSKSPMVSEEDMDRLEQEEVDELLQELSSRQQQQAEDETVVVVPSRCRQPQKYQAYQYHSIILERAQPGFRREWTNYKKEMAHAPVQLYLATKLYKDDTSTTTTNPAIAAAAMSTINASTVSTPTTSTTPTITTTDGTLVVQHSTSIGGESIITDDQPNCCSICFAELQTGQRIGNLTCGHEFHATCLKTWIGTGRRNTCPLCQAPNIAVRRPSRDDNNTKTTTTSSRRNGRHSQDDEDEGELAAVAATRRDRSESIPSSEGTASITLPEDHHSAAPSSQDDDDDDDEQVQVQVQY